MQATVVVSGQEHPCTVAYDAAERAWLIELPDVATATTTVRVHLHTPLRTRQ